ncbi:MAG TPA: hypothetical protein VMX76_02805 [Nevskiaceae bacterium]|nr:hypothetical protein [Nevskiaceae bacterium]
MSLSKVFRNKDYVSRDYKYGFWYNREERKFLNMLKKVFKKAKIKFLSRKLAIVLLFLLLATPVFGNETIRLHRFNGYAKQAEEQKASKDYQEASETFQKAKDTLSFSLILKSFKKEELEKIDNEIKEIKEIIDKQKEELKEIGDEIESIKESVNEKVKGATTEGSPSFNSPTSSQAPTSSQLNPEPTNFSSINQSGGEMITGSGSARLFPGGSPVNFSVSFSAEGGTIAVEVSGICNGTGTGIVKGVNQWNDYADVSGDLSGTCEYYGENFNVSGAFSGNIYLKEGRADGTWGGKTTSKIHLGKSGIWAFTFNPISYN